MQEVVLPFGALLGNARGISGDKSTIVGGAWNGTASLATRWTAASGNIFLGSLYSGGPVNSGTGSLARASSYDGSVVVGVTAMDTNLPDLGSVNSAFRWTPEQGMVPLPPLPNGSQSDAQNVSSDGRVIVGWATTVDDTNNQLGRAVRWVEDGPAEVLIDLPSGFAMAASSDGSTIVGFLGGVSSGEGFLWSETGVIPLPPPPGYKSAIPRDMSADGSVVVGTIYEDISSTRPQAAIWTSNTGWRTLNDVLQLDLGIDLQGVSLIDALSISDDGNVVVGNTQDQQSRRIAFRVDLGCVQGVGKRSAAECGCSAPTYTWKVDTGNSYDFASHWNPDGPPGADAIARFDFDGFVPVGFNEDATADALEIVAGRVKFDLSLNNYLLTGESECGPDLRINKGQSDDAELTIINGLLESRREAVVSHGRIVLEEDGTLITKNLLLGTEGEGTLTISDNANLRVDTLLQIALQQGSSAGMSFTGEASDDTVVLLPLKSEIGVYGNGIVLIEGKRTILGPVLLDPGDQPIQIVLGVHTGSEGTLILEGNDVQFLLPDTDGLRSKTLVVGAGGEGNFTLNGSAIRLDTLRIGESGSGSVSIKNGGVSLIDHRLQLGMTADSEGTLFLFGETEETNSLALLGDSWVGVGAKGTFEIKGNSHITGELSGPTTGEMKLGVLEEGEGSLIITGPQAKFLEFDAQPMNVTVGDAGKGDLQITEGGLARMGTLWLGKQATGFGSGFVGSGSELFTKKMAIGTGAFGFLQVEEGANVITDLLWVGPNGTVQGPLIAVDTFSDPSKRQVGGLFTDTLIVSNSATLEVDSLVMGAGATLGGTAVWDLPIINTGTITPGDSTGDTGVFTAAAGYTQTSEGVLAIELGPDGADRLDVTGTAVLDGIVRFELVGAHRPMPGEAFDIVTAGSVSGTFSGIEAQPGLMIRLVYESDRVIAVVDAVTVQNEGEEAVPSAFVLEQNFPNPFNPQTVIRYALTENGPVYLAVYDLLGREIERLVDKTQSKGTYEVVFDAGDLPSGTYLYRLSTGNFLSTKRMVLVR